MKKVYLFILCTIVSLQGMHAQTTTLQKKIAQRYDEYISSNWQGKDSILFAYNNDAILTTQTALKGNTNNTWDNSFRYVYTLSGSGKPLAQLRENWNGNTWINFNRYLYDYDLNDNLVLTSYDVWGGSTWNPTGKIENTGYDALGNWTLQVTSSWNNGWQYISKTSHQYISGTSKLQQKDKEIWNTTTSLWDKYERLFYTYYQDSIGSIIRSVPNASNAWSNASKFIYNYQGNPITLQSYIHQIWNQDSLKFLDTTRAVYSYNANNNVTQIVSENALGNLNWMPLQRTQFLYNGSNILIEKYTEDNIGGWQNTSRFTYAYTGSIVNEELYYTGNASVWNLNRKTNFQYDINNNLIFKQREDFNGANYVPFSRDFYYYAQFVVGLYDVQTTESNVVVYPNPTKNVLYFSFPNYEKTNIQINIVDILGRSRIIVVEPILSKQHTSHIDVSSLSNGYYFVQVLNQTSGKKQIAKIEIVK